MKNTLILVLIAAAVVAGVWYMRRGNTEYPAVSVSPSVSTTVSHTPTPSASRTPAPGVSPTPLASPTPGLIIQETSVFTVNIANFAFSPSPLTVKKGDVVVFKNNDSAMHTVTSLNQMFDSKNIRPGDQWTLATANMAPGTYEYRCTFHPSMRGTLIIQ